ncbi:winged helix DNA-binding domain-containing protein [Foetidibacter luteolus]|uniref:winged helix DNA-binding domain-containing protein n=1 Tax=Foetidibacter luteolus TaxID=2608880 RepID=UPI00129BBEE8|nr:winged helix DNA-binding domain-containing protein [Foetidibacter luteolus]
MNNSDIITCRLINQQIAATNCKTPEDVVKWMVAMQAQEYAMAKWAIGLRLEKASDTLVEACFNEGKILRTHLMRPTWHFVSPEDIRWLVALTAPRVNAINAYYYKKWELDNSVFKRSNNCLVKALQGGNMLTRTQLQDALAKAKIKADGVRLASILMKAELDAIICSGQRIGKQFSYALLEERAAPVKALSRAEALNKFVAQYFTSRGPATLQDFAYWSGLSMQDAKDAASFLPSNFEKITINKQEYYFIPGDIKAMQETVRKNSNRITFLMPDYDEYGMSYKNREAMAPKGKSVKLADSTPAPYHSIVLNGLMAGGWQKTGTDKKMEIATTPYYSWNKTQTTAVEKAVKRYKAFAAK